MRYLSRELKSKSVVIDHAISSHCHSFRFTDDNMTTLTELAIHSLGGNRNHERNTNAQHNFLKTAITTRLYSIFLALYLWLWLL